VIVKGVDNKLNALKVNKNTSVGVAIEIDRTEYKVDYKVCPDIGVGLQTLIRHILAVTGPICAPIPPLLHRQHRFMIAFSTS
jgi:hypothetical protein